MSISSRAAPARRAIFVLFTSTLSSGCPSTSTSPEAPSSEVPEPTTSANGPNSVATQSATIATGLGDGIAYEIRFERPETHYVNVEAHFPTDGRDALELMLPVWTPGSYLVREFFRHIEGIEVLTRDGGALPHRRTRKNRIRVITKGQDHVVLRYRVYCHEMSVRTNFVDDEMALLNGAPTFITRADALDRPHTVRVVKPEGYEHLITGLDPHPSGEPHLFHADSYHTLIDSPILLGAAAIYEYEVDGAKHLLVNQGQRDLWDGPRSAKDLERLTRTHLEFWGERPYDRYIFFNLLAEARGGLEHRNSSVLMTSRWVTKDRKAYVRWLGLASHELFHAWNVKRLRSKDHAALDYENEVYTRSLWIAEGFTSYYDDVLLRRSGLVSRKEYLDALSSQIKRLDQTPGRQHQSLENASFDAWIKFYRPDENSKNSAVSYYTKGAVVAFLLDAKIQRSTAMKRSLDDVIRRAYALYAGKGGYTDEQFRALVEEVAGRETREWLTTAVASTEELSLDEALAWYGLEVDTPATNDDKSPEEKRTEKQKSSWLGVSTKHEGGRVIVKDVTRDGPAFSAGINSGDEILAIEGYRTTAENLEARVTAFVPGDTIALTIARRGRLQKVAVRLGVRPKPRTLRFAQKPSATQAARVDRWLGPE